jgi:hypothetical protein
LKGIFEHEGRAKYPQSWILQEDGKSVSIQRYSCEYQGYWFGKFMTPDRQQVKEDFYQYLDEVYNNLPKPYYILYYYMEASVPDMILGIKNRLDPNKFEIIDMGTMAQMIKKFPTPDVVKAKEITSDAIIWNDNIAMQPNKWTVHNGTKLEVTKAGMKLTVPVGQTEGWISIKDIIVPKDTMGIEFDLKRITGGKLSIRLNGLLVQSGQEGAWHLWRDPVLPQEHITGSFEHVYIKQIQQNGYIPELSWHLCYAPKETGGELVIENFKFTKE